MPFLPETQIEIIRHDHPRGDLRAVMFDFDGTLSLVRRDWQGIMIPQMVAHLSATGTAETREHLTALVEEFVMKLNGKPTIHQMHELARQLRLRNAEPRDPQHYKQEFLDGLEAEINRRLDAIKHGMPADELTVPEVRRLLERLDARGIKLYLASGTEVVNVRRELAALGLAGFFGEHVYGPVSDDDSFSKAGIIAKILATGVAPHQLAGFGDGFVEIEELKKAGGLAVGVASEEETRQGVNPTKRERLIRAGADIIIGDYREHDQLLAWLGVEI